MTEDFIRIYKNVAPDGFCEQMVIFIDQLQQNGVGNTRQQSEGVDPLVKNDYQICFNDDMNFPEFEGEKAKEIILRVVQQAFDKYTEEFSYLRSIRCQSYYVKAQKTSPGGGYHIWHAEQGDGWMANRILVWLWYLNSLPEGSNGETEFLYQQKRVKPESNTFVLWPAAFTHVHRGNPVFGESFKYVLTGWFSGI